MASKSLCRAPLGTSDRNVVYLVPTHRSEGDFLKETKLERDRDLFVDTYSDLDELTETVTASRNVCEDLRIPRKFVHVFPNNKPWMSRLATCW